MSTAVTTSPTAANRRRSARAGPATPGVLTAGGGGDTCGEDSCSRGGASAGGTWSANGDPGRWGRQAPRHRHVPAPPGRGLGRRTAQAAASVRGTAVWARASRWPGCGPGGRAQPCRPASGGSRGSRRSCGRSAGSRAARSGTTTIRFGVTRYGPSAPEASQFGKYDTLTSTGEPDTVDVEARCRRHRSRCWSPWPG